MARDSGRQVCPRRECPLHPDGRASAPGQVEWAGLPVNLDMAFSRVQRDKVYVQHVMRKQGSRLSRWVHNGARPCVCEVATEDGMLGADAAESMSSR
ncbi:hypothetical protein [Mycobacterium sp. E796]|uniref:hypothetical protein n=1 Tax=Mycobacterium sp. E796 TaxID=1834151 RepID=UPI00080141F5|nr:hypothetical protein [Mycobacterium sp. E796]OBI48432.1 hypothetical protein A5706_27740 [Mycobacterium sp. E796]